MDRSSKSSPGCLGVLLELVLVLLLASAAAGLGAGFYESLVVTLLVFILITAEAS